MGIGICGRGVIVKLEVIVQNKENKKAYDISNIVKKISITTYLEIKPSKVEIDMIAVDTLDWIALGSLVSIKVDGHKLFLGYIFKFDYDEDNNASFVAYDQMRYLAYKDTLMLNSMSSAEVFTTMCKRFNLKHSVESKCTYKLPARVCEEKTGADIIEYAISQTLSEKGVWQFLEDEYGTLKLKDTKDYQIGLAIGDSSLLSSFSYEESIDDETYNYIKLVKENKETNKRDVYIQKDSESISKWGMLPYYEKVSDNMKDAQIRERASLLLKYYNKEQKTLKIKQAIGDLRIKAGRSFLLTIKDLKKAIPYNQYALCVECTHTFENDTHVMDLEVYV